MPGLTSTKIASWQHILVAWLGVNIPIYRCSIASYGLSRGLDTYELELQALSSYRLSRGADFLAGATSRTLKANAINPASGFTYFDHIGRQVGFSRASELIRNIERFAFCMILPQNTADGFDLYGLPFTNTSSSTALVPAKNVVIPEPSFHSAIRDWRRDQAIINNIVERRPPELTIQWDTDWDRTTYFQVGGKWTHRLDFGAFLKSRGERRPIVDIDDDKGDLLFNPPINQSYSANAITSTGRIFIYGLSRRLRGKVRVTVEYRVGGNTVTTRPQSYGAIVGSGLGRIEPTSIPSNDSASNIDAAIKRFNNWRPRVYSFTALPDMALNGWLFFILAPGRLVSFVGAGISDTCIVVRSEISQRGNRPAQLRVDMVRLRAYVAAQRGEGTPVLYGGRPVRYVEDIGYVPPPLVQYGGKFIRYASRGVKYG